MNKKEWYVILVIITGMILGIMGTAKAELVDLGDGTIKQIRNDAIFGDGSVLIWIKDANLAQTSGYDGDGYMTWEQANSWIDSLNTSNYGGNNYWRLPDTKPVNGVSYDYNLSYNGTTDHGFNIKSPNSELAYMYYVELGNIGAYDEDGNEQSGWDIINKGPFDNLQSHDYWSGTEYAPDPSFAFYFSYYGGPQFWATETNNGYAWAVRSVPIPGTLLLLVTGLIGMISIKRTGQHGL